MTTATDATIPLSSRVVRSETIDFTEIDDTVVLMDVKEGYYYELDPVAARVWALIESGPRIEEVYEVLATEYAVAPATCRDEVREFLRKLSDLAVVRVLRRDEAPKRGDGSLRDGSGPGGGASAAQRRSAPDTRAAWTTPAIRFMAIERTAGGPNEDQKPYATENSYYHPPS